MLRKWLLLVNFEERDERAGPCGLSSFGDGPYFLNLRDREVLKTKTKEDR